MPPPMPTMNITGREALNFIFERHPALKGDTRTLAFVAGVLANHPAHPATPRDERENAAWVAVWELHRAR